MAMFRMKLNHGRTLVGMVQKMVPAYMAIARLGTSSGVHSIVQAPLFSTPKKPIIPQTVKPPPPSPAQSPKATTLNASFLKTTVHCDKPPMECGKNDVGTFYQVEKLFRDQIFPTLHRQTRTHVTHLKQLSIMIRDSTLQILQVIKLANMDEEKPTAVGDPASATVEPLNSPAPATQKQAPILLIDGREGSGKTLALIHVASACVQKGWIVAHVPSALQWTHDSDEIDNSRKEHPIVRIDQNENAQMWLKAFQDLNAAMLPKLPLRGNYLWGTALKPLPENSTLLDLVALGQLDHRSAADVAAVLVKELTLLPKDIPVIVTVDNFNALFQEKTAIIGMDHKIVKPEQLTLARPFRKLLLGEWRLNAGAVVAATTSRGSGALPALDPPVVTGLLRQSKSLNWNVVSDEGLPRKEGSDSAKAGQFRYKVVLDKWSAKETLAFLTMLHQQKWIKQDPNRIPLDTIKMLTAQSPREICRVADIV